MQNFTTGETYLRLPMMFLKDFQARADPKRVRLFCSKVLRVLEEGVHPQPPPVAPTKVSLLSAAGYAAVGLTKARLPDSICE